MNNEKYLAYPIEIEKELSDFFNINSTLTIFEIGSCDGLDSIKYGRLFKNSKIFAFEPLLKNFKLIEANILKHGSKNIIPIQIALSDSIGKVEFHTSSGQPEEFEDEKKWDYGNKSSSLLPPNKTLELVNWLKFENKEIVDTTTLFEFCKIKEILLIDFVHMDVQGAELLVLKGAGSRINNIKMIWLEVENIELYKNQPLKQDIEKFMKEHHFTKIKDTVNHIAGDQLWVNLKFFPRKNLTNKIWKLYSSLFKK